MYVRHICEVLKMRYAHHHEYITSIIVIVVIIIVVVVVCHSKIS